MTTPFAHNPQAPIHRGVVLSHSQGDALSGYPSPDKAWPHVFERMLKLRGARVAIANYGKGGDTSADALARVHAVSRYGVPDFAGIWLDVNDPKLALVTRTVTGTGSVAEVQTITQGGNTPAAIIAGSFPASFGGNTSAPIAYNASAAAVQTALNAMASIASAGGVTVTGSAGAWTVTFNSVGARALITTDITSMLTLYVQAIVMALKHNAYGPSDSRNTHRGRQTVGPAAVATETALPQYSPAGERRVVLADGAANAGVAPPQWMLDQGILAASKAGAGTGGPSVWECVEPKAGIAGWHRIAGPGDTPLGGCTRIFLIGNDYNDLLGDTTSTPGTYNASLRAANDAVVVAERNPDATARAADPWVIRTDLYGFMRLRAVAGEASSSVHFNDATKLHLNNAGHHVATLAIFDGGPAGTAWPASWLTAIGAS